MSQHTNEKEVKGKPVREDRRNERRLSTLNLWQLHIKSLSKPENKPLIKRYHDNYELTEIHTISESTIISSDSGETRVTLLEDDDNLLPFDMSITKNNHLYDD